MKHPLIIKLLEERRGSEPIEDFSPRVFPYIERQSALALYRRIQNGEIDFPDDTDKIASAAKILGVSAEELALA